MIKGSFDFVALHYSSYWELWTKTNKQDKRQKQRNWFDSIAALQLLTGVSFEGL